MEQLLSLDTIVVQQQKEMMEILTSFETRNRYKVMASEGQELFFAYEVADSWFLRHFLKAMRPFKMDVVDQLKQPVLHLERPFTFIFHKIEVYDKNRVKLGYVRKRFSLIRRIYTVYDEADNEILELMGPILKPWTLIIQQQGAEIGRLVKRWSGLLKEAVSDADNFTLNFPMSLEVKHKAILLAAVFLIDFVQFEDRSR